MTRKEQEFREMVESSGYELLSGYSGVKDKVKLLHKSCEQVSIMTPDKFKRGQRCRWCTKPGRLKTNDWFIEQCTLNGFLDDYELLSEYKKSKENIKVKHLKCGTEYITKPDYILQGNRCPVCDKFVKPARRIEEKREIFIKRCRIVNPDLEIIGEYMGIKNDIKVKCKKGHEFYVLADNLNRRKERCRICNPISRKEQEILDYINSKVRCEKLIRGKICKYEIDCYCPDLNIGFDYNGLYWHSQTCQDKHMTWLYHKMKQRKFKEKGIKLFFLWEHWGEVTNKKLIDTILENGYIPSSNSDLNPDGIGFKFLNDPVEEIVIRGNQEFIVYNSGFWT